MSTLGKVIVAAIAVLFVAIAATVVVKTHAAQAEQPAIAAPMDPAPLEPKAEQKAGQEQGVAVVPQHPKGPQASPKGCPKKKLMPGKRQGLFHRFRHQEPAPQAS